MVAISLNYARDTATESDDQDSPGKVRTVLAARAEHVRQQVYALAEYAKSLHFRAISEQDERSLTAGLANLETEEEIKDWEKFVSEGIASQRRSYEKIVADFASAMQRAEPYLSSQSKQTWIERFERSTFTEKRYFLDHQFDSFIASWQKTHEERDELLTKPAMAYLTSEDVPRLTLFKDKNAFKELSYREKKDLVAMVTAAILARNKFGNELYHQAKTKLDSAAQRGIVSTKKVGIWMERIFSTRKDRATMEKFVRGNDKNSLSGLIESWKAVVERFHNVRTKLDERKDLARGFKRVSLDDFLDMHYAQRVSYVNEAERVLGTARNIQDENPLILEIRHYLDIGDWKGADDAINEANKESLLQVDRDRLFSMRQYLAQHRTDGGPRSVPSSSKEADAAWAEIQIVLQGELDPALRGLVNRLLVKGNFAINALRWTVYNYIWCHKNGYVNQEKSFEQIDQNLEATKERWEEEGDAGRNDVMYAQAYKRDEQKMIGAKKGDKAWIQYVNLTNENVMAGVADFYSKPHDPKVLYWTTFMGCRGTDPLDEGWHQRQLNALNKIRSATRTIENTGGKYRSSGVLMPETISAA